MRGFEDSRHRADKFTGIPLNLGDHPGGLIDYPEPDIGNGDKLHIR
jgi:hypothetical protein